MYEAPKVVTPLETLVPLPNITKKFRKVESTTSTDSENNSIGNYSDLPFDIRSGPDTVDSDIISSPYENKNSEYYSKVYDTQNISTNKSPIIDVCSYSNATIFLLQNGNIISEIKDDNFKVVKRTRIVCNIKLIRVVSFKGYLYGVDTESKLFMLSNDFNLEVWNWTPVSGINYKISHVSTTYDSSYLWLQTKDTGYLYCDVDTFDKYEKFENFDKKRIYGKDKDSYLEIDSNNVCTVYPQRNKVFNVVNAALTYYNELVTIKTDQQDEFQSIIIVDWSPYYIRTI